MNKKIYADGHMNGLNGVGGVFADSGYSALKIGKKSLVINYNKNNLTNNEAELLSIFHACYLAKKGDIVLSDSQIALNLSRSGKSNTDRLQLIAVAIKYIVDQKKLILQWIPREENPVT